MDLSACKKLWKRNLENCIHHLSWCEWNHFGIGFVPRAPPQRWSTLPLILIGLIVLFFSLKSSLPFVFVATEGHLITDFIIIWSPSGSSIEGFTRWWQIGCALDSLLSVKVIKGLLPFECILSLDFDLGLGPGYHVIHSLSDVVHFVFSVEVLAHLVICLHKFFKFFLEAVVLVVQTRHVSVQCLYLSLQIYLVFQHLLWVLLKPVDFEIQRLFVLGQLVHRDLELLELQAALFACLVLVLISSKHLSLRILVLFVLVFEIAQLTIELIKCIF